MYHTELANEARLIARGYQEIAAEMSRVWRRALASIGLFPV